MAKTYENYINTDLDYAKTMDRFRSFDQHRLDATSQILIKKECGKLTEYMLEIKKVILYRYISIGIFPKVNFHFPKTL